MNIYCASCDEMIESSYRTRQIARYEHAKFRHGGDTRKLNLHLNDPMSDAELVHLQQFEDLKGWRIEA